MRVQASIPVPRRPGRRWGPVDLGRLDRKTVHGDPGRTGPSSGRTDWAVSNNYWSSSTNVNNPDNAWNVNFNNGNVNNDNKTNDNYARAVRSGT